MLIILLSLSLLFLSFYTLGSSSSSSIITDRLKTQEVQQTRPLGGMQKKGMWNLKKKLFKNVIRSPYVVRTQQFASLNN